MACLAVLTDLSAVLRLMLVVVTAETTGRIDVADVASVRAERHVHVRKNTASKNFLQRCDRFIDIGCRISGNWLIKASQRCRNSGTRGVVRWVRTLQRLHC